MTALHSCCYGVVPWSLLVWGVGTGHWRRVSSASLQKMSVILQEHQKTFASTTGTLSAPRRERRAGRHWHLAVRWRNCISSCVCRKRRGDIPAVRTAYDLSSSSVPPPPVIPCLVQDVHGKPTALTRHSAVHWATNRFKLFKRHSPERHQRPMRRWSCRHLKIKEITRHIRKKIPKATMTCFFLLSLLITEPNKPIITYGLLFESLYGENLRS